MSTQLETTEINIWETAQRTCWTHVEVATNVTKLLDLLKTIKVASVIPVISTQTPTIMLTPDRADDLNAVKAVCRLIKHAVQADTEWLKRPLNDEWLLTLKAPQGITIDLFTRLPASKETPIEV